MSKYKNILNPFTGQLQKVFSGDLVTFKAGVASVGNLPTEGNEKGDGRIANDTGHLYIWDGSTWQDQGDIVDLKWASIENKPTSSVGDIDDAIDKKHIQNTDIALRTDKLTVDASGNTVISGELKIKVYSQDTEPILGENQKIAIWEDTSVSGSPQVFLIYRRGEGDQISVELA